MRRRSRCGAALAGELGFDIDEDQKALDWCCKEEEEGEEVLVEEEGGGGVYEFEEDGGGLSTRMSKEE